MTEYEKRLREMPTEVPGQALPICPHHDGHDPGAAQYDAPGGRWYYGCIWCEYPIAWASPSPKAALATVPAYRGNFAAFALVWGGGPAVLVPARGAEQEPRDERHPGAGRGQRRRARRRLPVVEGVMSRFVRVPFVTVDYEVPASPRRWTTADCGVLGFLLEEAGPNGPGKPYRYHRTVVDAEQEARKWHAHLNGVSVERVRVERVAGLPPATSILDAAVPVVAAARGRCTVQRAAVLGIVDAAVASRAGKADLDDTGYEVAAFARATMSEDLLPGQVRDVAGACYPACSATSALVAEVADAMVEDDS